MLKQEMEQDQRQEWNRLSEWVAAKYIKSWEESERDRAKSGMQL